MLVKYVSLVHLQMFLFLYFLVHSCICPNCVIFHFVNPSPILVSLSLVHVFVHRGPKFEMIARATMRLQDVGDVVNTHDLILQSVGGSGEIIFPLTFSRSCEIILPTILSISGEIILPSILSRSGEIILPTTNIQAVQVK